MADENFYNPLVDNLLEQTVKANSAKIEPLAIQDLVWRMDRGALVRIRAAAGVRNVRLNGLSSIARTGEVILNDLDAATSRLAFNFELTNMTHTFDGIVQAVGISSNRKFNGTVTRIAGQMVLRYSKATDELMVMTVKVTKLDNLEIIVKGGRRLAEMVENAFIRSAVAYLERGFRVTIEYSLQVIFNRAVVNNRVIKSIMG